MRGGCDARASRLFACAWVGGDGERWAAERRPLARERGHGAREPNPALVPDLRGSSSSGSSTAGGACGRAAVGRRGSGRGWQRLPVGLVFVVGGVDRREGAVGGGRDD